MSTTTVPTFNDWREMLAWLGDSPDADGVADKLRLLGVQGERGKVCGCPVAVALSSFGTPVSVGRFALCRNEEDERVPEPVFTFFAYFDTGAYPDLVAP